MTSNDGRGGHDRRQFLRRLGVGAAGVALGSGAETAAAATPARVARTTRGDRFGRMFGGLPPFASPSPALEQALLEIGKAGGMMDARDDLAAGPIALIVDPGLSAHNRNNPAHTAGTTFVGQFLDHDMTLDAGSKLGRPTAPETSHNARTPAFDLDSVYGSGPIASKQLYDADDPVKLKVESGGRFEDVPRAADGTAVIGDPRNDENLIISGLQAAFLCFHNRAVDRLRAERGDTSDLFARARRFTTWHYQWTIVHEFLPQIVGQSVVDDVLAHPRFYRVDGEPFIPVEFQGAAYRFGHSMVRPSYRLNMDPVFAMIFDPAERDLRGGRRAPDHFVGWQTFFDFGDGEVKPNKRIDTQISTPLFNLPLPILPGQEGPTSLASRNLLRHLTWKLPSGQRLAAEMGLPSLARGDLAELSPYRLDRSTPLWYYVLKEAEVVEDGLRLGPVGARIVAEVMLGLLRTDRASYLHAGGWTPELASDGRFGMVELLRFAQVDPVSRGM